VAQTERGSVRVYPALPHWAAEPQKERVMKQCLVVDDSRVMRKIARKILQELQFTADEAEDGAAALEICKKNMPDAILLDWNMPAMSGIEFLRALRREPSGDKPIVVYCTTENDITHITEAVGAGANEYLIKPFDKEIVEAKLVEAGLM
jgi:two-component system chemotaxis response regulator CheY